MSILQPHTPTTVLAALDIEPHELGDLEPDVRVPTWIAESVSGGEIPTGPGALLEQSRHIGA